MIAELMQNRGRVLGVDASESRMMCCRKLMLKHKLASRPPIVLEGTAKESRKQRTKRKREEEEAALFVNASCSSTTASSTLTAAAVKTMPHPDSGIVRLCIADGSTFEERLEQDSDGIVASSSTSSAHSLRLYDRILLDAQCTHDGSVRHVDKAIRVGKWGDLEDKIFGDDVVARTVELQKALISNAFRLLRPGGVLVYSTCSLTHVQNEGVVEWLVSQRATENEVVQVTDALKAFQESEALAKLRPHDAADSTPLPPCRPGYLPGTLRFDPLTSQTSGLFVARLIKPLT